MSASYISRCPGVGESFRPTRDADLLGFGDLSDDALVATFQDLCPMSVESDGLRFDASSVRVAEIRPQDEYGGRPSARH